MDKKQHEPYDEIASIYDHWQASFDRPYQGTVSKLIKKEIRRYRIAPGKFLDLACGTGDTALFMTELGWEVTGVDSSGKMLEYAEEKAKQQKKHILFIQQRLQDLALDTHFQMAGSFYDCLNHIISKRSLLKALKRLRNHLESGSLFVFDTNTLRCYRELWNTTSVGHEDNYTLIMQNTFNESTGRAVSNVTIFTRDTAYLYEKRAVIVQERYYTDDEMKHVCTRAGFEVLRQEPLHLFKFNEPDPYKNWWVCRSV
jgi:ubiquinone/menaquinone biosynthesis C-methylase UbiE